MKTNPNELVSGFTKRELIAKDALVALISASNIQEGIDVNNTALIAVELADALIEKLNKE